jgi:hypothetical protein
MKTNIALPLFFIYCLLDFLGINAQGMAKSKLMRTAPDTIVVYDTIFVTDTIRIFKPLKKIAQMESLPSSCMKYKPFSVDTSIKKILIFSRGAAATFSINGILDSVQIIHLNKSESMKKLSFWGVVLFAFQNMVLAQNNVSLQIGVGAYKLQNIDQMNVRPAADFMAGLGYSRSMGNGKMRLNIDLNYHYKLKTSAYFPEEVRLDPFMETRIARYTKPFQMINLPVSVQWNKKTISPFVGAAPYFEWTNFDQIFTTDSGESKSFPTTVNYYGLDLFAGVEIPISHKFQARISYYRSIIETGGASPKRVEAKINYRF